MFTVGIKTYLNGAKCTQGFFLYIRNWILFHCSLIWSWFPLQKIHSYNIVCVKWHFTPSLYRYKYIKYIAYNSFTFITNKNGGDDVSRYQGLTKLELIPRWYYIRIKMVSCISEHFDCSASSHIHTCDLVYIKLKIVKPCWFQY